MEKVFEVLSIKDVQWKDSDEEEFLADIFVEDLKIGSLGVNF